MKIFDLLLTDNEQTAKINDSFLEDMGMSAFEKVINNDSIYKIFAEVLSKPLINKDKIIEREKILKDFIKYPYLLKSMKRICDIAKENKFPPYTRTISGIPPKTKLAAYLEVVKRSLKIPVDLFVEMDDKTFESASLKDLYTQLDMLKKLESINIKIDKLASLCFSGNFSLSLVYNNLIKFESAKIYSDLGIESKSLKSGKNMRNIKTGIGFMNDNSFIYDDNFLIQIIIEDIEKAATNNLSYILSNINSHILVFCSKLSYSLAFYESAIKILDWYKLNGIGYSFPVIVEPDQACISAQNLIDISLAYHNLENSKVIPNDFIYKNNRYYFVSGANHGGKTTFIKSIGTAQIFAQSGLPVGANKYASAIFYNFISHFPKDEDETMSFGKLAEELTRIRKDFPMMADNALVLLNESFASTTEKEGCEIAIDFMKALSLTNSKLIFVTHIYELLKNHKNISKGLHNDIGISNLITASCDSPSNRSFKIIEGEPQASISSAIGIFAAIP
ncbi:MAG: MutS-related protein [Saccharofermentanales bacterium]